MESLGLSLLRLTQVGWQRMGEIEQDLTGQ
jgi:hypothetical protein